MIPDRESCWRALAAHDVRFDGVFFVGVTSTRIYCRPICRARTPRRDRCRFFASAAAAERAGFRPCLRCRPELAPGLSREDASARIAGAAVRRIAAGALNERGVDDLARELGVGGRQLRRVVEREIGVSPVELAQTCRLLLAKRLLSETTLPVTQIAYTSGFRSLRRFNALFRERYRLNPSVLRRESSAANEQNGDNGSARTSGGTSVTPATTSHSDEPAAPETISLTLSYRPPLAWRELLAFLAVRATPGVEHVDGERYLRTIQLDGHSGWLTVEAADHTNRARGRRRRQNAVPTGENRPGALQVTVSVTLLPVLMPLLARLRGLFDLDASPSEIDAHLAREGLATLVRRTPGLRVPGAADGFELAWRAILGQQVSVRGATTLAGRLASTFGEPIATPHAPLRRLPPSPARLADASWRSLAAIGLPRARAESLHTIARAAAGRTIRFDTGSDGDTIRRQLTDLPGIGEWTAEYIAMRALRWPDAFPTGDLALRRATGGLSPARLRQAAERWRPWRAYAAMHLWNSLAVSDIESTR